MLEADLRVYLVTDLQTTGGRPLAGVVEACLEGGVRAVQLRAKGVGTRELLTLGTTLRAVTARYQARLLVNDRIDVALAIGADGVHLPEDGLPPGLARQVAGPDRLVGVSTHSVVQAEAAARAGADFVVFGPVYDTPSKRSYGPPQGLAALADVCRRVPVPVLAIGGVTAERIAEVRRVGATGVAVIRALLDADDPRRAAETLLEAWPEGR